jgi:hypothetical protein
MRQLGSRPYAGGVIKWFAAQLGSVGVLLLEFLLTVLLAADVCRGRAGNTAAFSFWP